MVALESSVGGVWTGDVGDPWLTFVGHGQLSFRVFLARAEKVGHQFFYGASVSFYDEVKAALTVGQELFYFFVDTVYDGFGECLLGKSAPEDYADGLLLRVDVAGSECGWTEVGVGAFVCGSPIFQLALECLGERKVREEQGKENQ